MRTPRYVLHQMRLNIWCPITVHVLLGQLDSSRTILLSSLQKYMGSKNHAQQGARDQNPEESH